MRYCCQRDAAHALYGAGVVVCAALFEGVIRIPDQIVAAGGGDGVQVQSRPATSCALPFSPLAITCAR
jgi:hypothetical protein